jgi:hypothetical protein
MSVHILGVAEDRDCSDEVAAVSRELMCELTAVGSLTDAIDQLVPGVFDMVVAEVTPGNPHNQAFFDRVADICPAIPPLVMSETPVAEELAMYPMYHCLDKLGSHDRLADVMTQALRFITGDERRLAPRFQLDIPVTIHDNGRSGQTFATNISLSGMQIELGDQLIDIYGVHESSDVPSHLGAWLETGEDEAFSFDSKVVYWETNGSVFPRAGLRFTHIEPSQRLNLMRLLQ